MSRRQGGTLVDILTARAAERPDAIVFGFLGTDAIAVDQASYRDLLVAAGRVASVLRDRGAVGERVLIVAPPGRRYLEWFLGCVLAGAVAVPSAPPTNSQRAERLRTVIANAGAGFAVGAERQRRLLAGADLRWFDVDDHVTAPESEAPAGPAADDVAFLQYTSGSTSAPKGVVVTHSALVANLGQMTEVFGLDPAARGVSWLPPYHDMGLIGGILVPVFAGFRMDLMDPVAFSRDPLGWIRAVAASGATISGGPDTAFELAARELAKHGDDLELDLSRWSTAFVGAEPVRAETLARFAAAAAPLGFDRRAFRPCYGLAEATLMVTCAPAASVAAPVAASGAVADGPVAGAVAEDPAAGADPAPVSCGPPVPGVEVLVVDPSTGRPVEAGAVGEVWVRGPSVAAGYWRAPAATAERFHAAVPGAADRYLRTGDLGLLTGSGELVPTGRLSDLMIVAGRNVYPQDLEAAVRRAADPLEPGMAAAFELDGEPAVLLECRVPDARAESLLRELRDAVLAECDVRPAVVALARTGTLPRTSSGKVQRSLTRERFVAGRCHLLATLDDRADQRPDRGSTYGRPVDRGTVLAHLRRRLADAGFPVDAGDDPAISALGLDSLFLIRMAGELDLVAGGPIDRAHLWRTGSLSELATLVVRTRAGRPALTSSATTPDAPPSAAGAVPLTGPHAGMWLAEQLNPATTNLWMACEVDGLAVEVLTGRIDRLVERHDAFRLSFEQRGGQVVALPAAVTGGTVTTVVDGTRWSTAHLRDWMAARTTEPFDLGVPPLLRAFVVERPTGLALLLVAPHLVLDFQSILVLAEELMTGTAAGSAASYRELLAAYADTSSVPADPASEPPPGADLMLPFRRSTQVSSTAAAEERTELSARAVDAIRELARSQRTTPLAVLLAVYVTALHQLSGQEQITVGVPETGRAAPRFAGTVGMAMHPVPVTVRMTHGRSLAELADDIGRQLRATWERRSTAPTGASPAPFETVVIRNSAQGTRWPQLALYETSDGVELDVDGARWRSVAIARRLVAVPLTMVLAEQDDRVVMVLRFQTDRYDDAGVRELLHAVRMVAERLAAPAAVTAPPVTTTPAAGSPVTASPATEPTARGGTVVSGLREVVHRFGARVALEDSRTALTYDELWAAVSSAAGALVRNGVRPGDRIGILHRRDVHAVVATLAVSRAGAAFVHLDVGSPPARLRDMVADAGVRLVVACPDNAPTAARLPVPWLASDAMTAPAALTVPAAMTGPAALAVPAAMTGPVAMTGPAALTVPAAMTGPAAMTAAPDLSGDPPPAAAAYVSFTSGSSGRPKGVVVSHRAAVAGAHGTGVPVALGPADVVCGISPFGWDIAVADILAALLRGATLAVAGEEHESDGTALRHFLDRHRVTVLQTTPQRWRLLLAAGWRPAPGFRAISGGDSMTSADVTRFHQVGAHVWNFYGPTEATFWATCFDFCDPHRPGDVPIGRPLGQYRVYVLDEADRPVPPGAVGELHIGGAAVADGYAGMPRTTAERFVPDPFSAVAGARMYRTGDLVRWRDDVGLSYVGRFGSYAKLRGYRVELGEIEGVLAALPAVREAAAGIVDGAGPGAEAEVVGYVVPADGVELDLLELNRGCAERLPQYMIPTRYAVLAALPVTGAGKVDRAALREVPLEAVRGAVARRPGTATETLVAEVFEEVLGRGEVDVRDDLFLIGGYSLRAMQVASRLSERTGAAVGVRDVFTHRTVEALAKWLDAEGPARRPTGSGPPSGGATGTVLRGQRRLWTMQELSGTAELGMPVLLAVPGGDATVVAATVRALVDRHALLRSAFALVDGVLTRLPGEPAAVPDALLMAPDRDAGGAAARDWLAAARARPWRLDSGPPLRTAIVDVPGYGVFVAMVVHHIAFDGWSGQLLVTEFAAAYRALAAGGTPVLAPLAELDDVLVRVAAGETDEATRDDVAYFVRQVAMVPELPLPLAGGGPVPPTGPGDGRCVVDAGATLHDAARRLGATPFAVAVAAFSAVLGRWGATSRFVLGLDVANRPTPEAEAQVGYFANQVPVAVDLAGKAGLAEVTARVGDALVEAIEHGAAPYDAILHAVRRAGWTGERLFAAKVVHQPLRARRLPLDDGAHLEVCDPDHLSRHDPLSLWVWEDAGHAVLELHHRSDACGEDVANRVLADVLAELRAVIDGTGFPKERLDMSLDDTEVRPEPLPAFDDIDITPVDLDPAGITVSVDGGRATKVLLVHAQGVGTSARDWLAGNPETWREGLRTHGAVLLRGFDVSSAAALADATDVVFTEPYDTAEHPRKMVDDGRVVTPVDYSSELELYWHNEDTFNDTWPALISFACAKVPASGGQTTFVDGTQVLSAFSPEARDRFTSTGVTYTRRFYPGFGLPWQTVFGTDDPAELARRCDERGEELAWEDGVLCVRATRPAVRSGDGEACWIAQILHWHEHCLPADVRADLTTTLGGKLPRGCTFGDGTPIADETVQQLIDRSRGIEYPLDWQVGDMILVDNRRQAHGRRPYRGDRGVLVALGDPIRHVPSAAGEPR